jgi:signal peptide peptidase SppA
MKKSNKKFDIMCLCPNIVVRALKLQKSVSIVRLEGIISGAVGIKRNSISLDSVRRDIDKAFSFPEVQAVAVVVNSPGGSPVQSELISNYLKSASEKNNIPIYTFAEDVAASGGYWLLCSGKKMYASEMSILGSIGVVSSGFGFVEAIKKLGIERRVTTQGKSKSISDPFVPEKESDKKIIGRLQEDIHKSFKAVVTGARGKKLKILESQLFSGEIWSGRQSLKHGLIDDIGDVFSVMKKEFGEDVKFNHIKKEASWIKKKMGVGFDPQELVDSCFEKIENKIESSRFGID